MLCRNRQLQLIAIIRQRNNRLSTCNNKWKQRLQFFKRKMTRLMLLEIRRSNSIRIKNIHLDSSRRIDKPCKILTAERSIDWNPWYLIKRKVWWHGCRAKRTWLSILDRRIKEYMIDRCRISKNKLISHWDKQHLNPTFQSNKSPQLESLPDLHPWPSHACNSPCSISSKSITNWHDWRLFYLKDSQVVVAKLQRLLKTVLLLEKIRVLCRASSTQKEL